MKDPAHHPRPTQRRLIREARRNERERKRMREQRERLEQYIDEERVEWIPLREPILRRPSHGRRQ